MCCEVNRTGKLPLASTSVASSYHRSPWLRDRAELLVVQLKARHDLTIDLDTAAHDIAAWRDQIAQRLRIQPRSANPYVTDEAIAEFADHIAERFRDARDRHVAAVESGEVACLDAKRRQRFPRPPA